MHKETEPLGIDRASSADCGTIVYSPGGQYGPRYQNDIQLVLLHTGHMNVTIDTVEHSVSPGHVILLKPGHREFFEFARTQETWHRWIAVHIPDLSEREEEELDQLPFCRPISAELNKLTDLMLNLKEGVTAESGQMRHIGIAALHLFAHEHTRERRLHNVHPSVVLAKSMIHERYAEEWTLNGLAAHVNVTPEHLIRLFRIHENTTPIKYLWHYRVRQAIEMLAHTGFTIGEISLRCGFKTAIHFSRCLKQRTGMSPSEIRKEAWQDQ